MTDEEPRTTLESQFGAHVLERVAASYEREGLNERVAVR